MLALEIIGYILLGIVLYHTLVRIIRKIHPFPIPTVLTDLIDNPLRRKFLQNPEKIANNMHLIAGMTVLEIGPGKGSYTTELARRILPDGIVYAVDVADRVIDRLNERINEEEIPNIVAKIDNAYSLSFDDNTFDCISMITCLPEIPNPTEVLKECRRVLKPGGQVSLCELFLDPDYPLRKTEKKWAIEANLALDSEFGNWWSYQLIFRKND